MFYALKNIPQCFYSQSFYRELIRKRSGLGWGFILVLMFLIGAQITLSMRGPAQEIHAAIPSFFASLPEILFKNGKLSIEGPMPYFIRLDPTDPDSKFIVIDTNQKTEDVESLHTLMEQKKIYMLITADKMVMSETDGVKVNALMPPEVDAKMTHTHWETFAHTAQKFVYPIMAFMVLLGATLGGLLRVFVGGLSAMLLSLAFGNRLDYESGVRLAAVTAIPCTIFMLLVPALHAGTFFALWVLYILFALWSDKMLAASAQQNP